MVFFRCFNSFFFDGGRFIAVCISFFFILELALDDVVGRTDIGAMGELLLNVISDADALKTGDSEFYIVVSEIRLTIEKVIRDGVERGRRIVRVVDGMMIFFIHRLLVVELIVVVHDVVGAAAM